LSLAPAALVGASAEGYLALLLALAVLIAAAKFLGEISMRLGQPAVLGELMAGLILGPTFLGVLDLPVLGASAMGGIIHQLGQLGVIWLMFAAGLEIELGDLRKSGRPALLGGTLGVVAPLALGWGVAWAFGYPLIESVGIGLVLSATSVSISAQTLLELRRLGSREGIALLGAAVIDDVLVVVLLAVVVALSGGESSLGAILLQLGRMALVLALVFGLALVVLPRVAEQAERLRVSQGLLSIVLASVLLLAWLTEFLGSVAAITGAFLAGVGLARSHLREEIERGLSHLAYAFFVPLFLVDVGLQSNARALDLDMAVFAVIVVLVAAVSKVLGSGLGAWLGGFERGAATRMGVGMISRGEVGLIVAGVGVTEGILDAELLTVVVLMVLATTLITPPLLRWAFSRTEVGDGATG
jgi:Kef-type K+ transport system membrane component KefB